MSLLEGLDALTAPVATTYHTGTEIIEVVLLVQSPQNGVPAEVSLNTICC